MSNSTAYLVFAAFMCSITPALAQKAVKLQVDHMNNPLIVDSGQPILSWQIEDGRRGARQTAYQVRAASRAELLQTDHADILDTQKVVSDASVNVAWPGKALASKTNVIWAVRVWDQNNKPSSWSKPATFGTGLRPADWRADWIGMKSVAAAVITLAGG